MELKIPPPLVALFSLFLMWLISPRLSDFSFALPGQRWIALGFVLIGIATAVSATRDFKRASTTINPLQPHRTSALVQSGVFSYTRNPMYLGMLLCLIGAGIYFANVVNFAVAAFFMAYITTFQIKPEERVLRQLFGPEFDAYCQQVRRWL